MYLGSFIRKYREDHNMTMQEFADKSDLSKSYISMLERNRNPQNQRNLVPSVETFKKVAIAMNISLDDLIKLVDSDQPIQINDVDFPSNAIPPSARSLPIMGTICAGSGLVCEDDYQGHFIIDIDVKADYCLRVKGDSMEEANIFDKDIVFISNSFEFENGKIYAVEDSGIKEASLKRVSRDSDFLILSPCNSKYHEVVIKDLSEVRIVGECVGVYHSMK